MKQDGAAMVMLMASLQQNPENVEGLHNLANCMKRQGHAKSSRVLYEQALKLDPHNVQVMCGLAGSYINCGEPQVMFEWAEKALNLDPDNGSAGYYKGMALMEMGKFEEGFKFYENRKRIPEWTKRVYTAPQWDGKPVKTLLIHGEQGIGDEILFMGWFSKIRHLADRVIVECTPRIKTVFERSFGVKCYSTDKEAVENEPSIDAVCAMGSLPSIAGGFPPQGRYIFPDPDKVAKYRQKLHGVGPGPYIGFSWHGGVVRTHAHYRTTNPEEWKRLASYGTPISVQYGESGKAAEFIGIPHWQEAIDDLDELIALLAALDLVVTVNNTTVHMCGALDVPCWTLTPSKPAWRYGLKGEEMKWYRSVRQFRQTGDDWSSAFADVETALGDYLRMREAA